MYQLHGWRQHRQLSLGGRGSNLSILGLPNMIYFDFTIDYEQALAFRKANGGYLRKGQWEDLTVEVYIV